ncbi:hypothetical protein AOQ84DRAFT_68933 [Glonium stellatum]|uniref:Uncharacterized protein n=1 Tax=Glonium stellatum TaxID=574774 RepID=A0A8E2JRK9_9PEZI|nr:hypothetical protein AOQ84DRAFT_68933 [Glonium stellatum]
MVSLKVTRRRPVGCGLDGRMGGLAVCSMAGSVWAGLGEQDGGTGRHWGGTGGHWGALEGLAVAVGHQLQDRLIHRFNPTWPLGACVPKYLWAGPDKEKSLCWQCAPVDCTRLSLLPSVVRRLVPQLSAFHEASCRALGAVVLLMLFAHTLLCHPSAPDTHSRSLCCPIACSRYRLGLV